MDTEYKISTIIRSDKSVKVYAQFFYILSITEEGIERQKIEPDREYVFSPTYTDEAINATLYRVAQLYGTPINT